MEEKIEQLLTKDMGVYEVVAEFRQNQNLIEPDGFLADVGEDYEAVDFNMEVMEDWLKEALTTLTQQIQEEMMSEIIGKINIEINVLSQFSTESHNYASEYLKMVRNDIKTIAQKYGIDTSSKTKENEHVDTTCSPDDLNSDKEEKV